MPIAIIGSRAAKEFYPKKYSTPRDMDFIASWDSFQKFLSQNDLTKKCIPLSGNKFVAKDGDKIYEFEIAWEGSTGESFLRSLQDENMGSPAIGNSVVLLPSLDWLYTLKLSHRYLKDSPHFQKTRKDIEFFRSQGCKVTNLEWLKQREKETYKNNLPKLNVRKSEFFSGDAIQYVYDHDTLHEAVKHLDQPAYRYYMREGAEVQCDRSKWEKLPHEWKLFGVLEEAYVLALERSQIPFPKTPRKISFCTALEKICTSITSGWFREFAYDHYDFVLSLYDEGYVDRFQKALENGTVKLHAQ